MRYIFDQINNLLLVIIMINIASGIIIDTFGQLREEENKMQSDIKDKCFICGQEKYAIIVYLASNSREARTARREDSRTTSDKTTICGTTYTT